MKRFKAFASRTSGAPGQARYISRYYPVEDNGDASVTFQLFPSQIDGKPGLITVYVEIDINCGTGALTYVQHGLESMEEAKDAAMLRLDELLTMHQYDLSKPVSMELFAADITNINNHIAYAKNAGIVPHLTYRYHIEHPAPDIWTQNVKMCSTKAGLLCSAASDGAPLDLSLLIAAALNGRLYTGYRFPHPLSPCR